MQAVSRSRVKRRARTSLLCCAQSAASIDFSRLDRKIFFITGVIKTCGSFTEAKKPEHAKAKSAEKKGCCCGSKKANPETAANDGSVIKFKAPQMSCGGCANKVKNLLTGVDGVTDVAVNLESKIVTVNYDSQKTDAAKIQDSFKQINYTVEKVH